MSRWWQNDMADASQGLFSDPNLALQIATLPSQLMSAQQEQAEEYARTTRGGFLKQTMDLLSAGGNKLDGALSHLGVGEWNASNAAKIAGKTLWYPVDKVASGFWWVTSELMSQPLSTTITMLARDDLGTADWYSPSDWADTYHHAEHISPGMAFSNAEGVYAGLGEKTLFGGIFGYDSNNFTKEESARIKQQTDKFLYDNDYWRNRQGWKYTVGSGALDFATVLGLDPAYAGLKVVSAGVKGLRSVRVEGESIEQAKKFRVTYLDAVTNKITESLARTPEQIAASKSVNNFFEWSRQPGLADGSTRKSLWEVAQHPIWGRGRRENPAKWQLSALFANADEVEQPLIMRTALGDNNAIKELATKNKDLTDQLGRMQDNRQLVASVKYTPALYGKFSQGAHDADMLKFQTWQAGRLESLNGQISAMETKGDIYARMLAGADKSIDDFSPGESALFGTMKSVYRMGPLALRNTEKAADASIKAQAVDRYGRRADGGFVSRTIRKGYYSTGLRVIQSFGDKLPDTLINHNDPDASERVLEMLKSVPGLGAEVRLGMLNSYTAAPDKVAKSQVLETLKTSIVEHMSAGRNLDYQAAKAIDEAIRTGTFEAYEGFKGRVASSPLFTTAENTKTGRRADKYEDGEGWLTGPVAKTQLSYSEPLLNVKELGRFLDRHSGYLASIKTETGKRVDDVVTVLDGLSNIWKATTLLRPGYILRAPSEEMAASAIKFGLMSSIMMSAHGGKNWVLNRGQHITALTGEGSWTSPVTGKTRLKILEPGMKQTTEELGLKPVRLKMSNAWPVVMDRIDREKTSLIALQKQIAKMESKEGHDPNVLAGLKDDALEHEDVLREFTDYSHDLLRLAEDVKGRRVGEATFEHRGITIPEAFSREWEHPIPRDQISSDAAMQTIFARGEAIDTARMIKTGTWTAVEKEDPNHMASMLDALNKQWGQDDLFKLVAGDMTMKAAGRWIHTPVGRYHRSLLGGHGRDEEALLYGVRDTLQQYTAGNPALLNKISKGEEITEAEVKAAIAYDDLPAVHGEEVKGLVAHSRSETAAALVDNYIASGFNKLGTIPTDILSRNPTFARAHEARMRNLVDQEISYQQSIGKGDALTSKQLNAMHQKADKLARKDISQVVYDPTRTTATQALRFIAPFMAAHVDGLQRWGGIIAEKPQFLSQAAKIYNAPVAANLVTDRYGNAVDQDGYAEERDENGKITGRRFVGIEERVLHLKVPDGTKGLVKQSDFDVPIKIQALNTILPGDPWWNPGTGPIVTVAASKLAEKDPAMGDFLQWAKVLPYGPQGFKDSLTPAYIKNVWSAFNPSSEKFQQSMLAEYQRQVADYHKGGEPPDMRKAEKNAKKFMYLKALASWALPAQTQATPLSGTPYQFYVDQYRKFQQVDPKKADDRFLERYGEDYFIFTASLSKSLGIAPTVSAFKTSKMYQDLIAGDSSLAPFIIGDVYNKGEFSASAYFAQEGMTIGGQKVREKQSVQDAVEDNQRRLGWAAYGKMMSGIDSAFIRAGFHSYEQQGAEDFKVVKQQAQQMLMQLYPAWEQDFNTTDRGVVPRRIQSFEILVQDPRLANDPMRQDIPVLTTYLAYRRKFKEELSARGASRLGFGVETEVEGVTIGGEAVGPNADIARSWRMFQTSLIASNTKFADVFHRYLSNDDLQ